MRWGAGEAQFVRPVHWLVLLFGREVVPATRCSASPPADVSFGTASWRPRRCASHAGRATRTLLTRGKVIAASTRGARASARRSKQLADGFGGRAIMTDALLDEVTALVEWPVAIAGQFEPRFLRCRARC
jgi:glycyl-tRNA synthetase beta chain